MSQALALSAPATLRVRIGLLVYAAAASGLVASHSGPIAAAVSAAFTSSSQVVTGRLSGGVPRNPPPISLNGVQPFYLTSANPVEAERATRCLTDAIYYEAANEPLDGQRAVAQVVINRLRDPHFPKSVCGVVYEGWERRTGCQFSFVCDGSIRRRHADPALWDRLRPIAVDALHGYVQTSVGTATHYYAQYVRPNWVRTTARVAEIGQHIFCSWRGKAGLPSALDRTYQGGELQIAEAALDGEGTPSLARHERRRRG